MKHTWVGGRCAYVYRRLDRSGALVTGSVQRAHDMRAAKHYSRSAKQVTGITPDRVTTDGQTLPPRDQTS